MESIAQQLAGLGPIAEWVGLILLLGASWATLWARLGQVRGEQRRTSRRLRSMAHRVRAIEIRLGPGPDD